MKKLFSVVIVTLAFVASINSTTVCTTSSSSSNNRGRCIAQPDGDMCTILGMASLPECNGTATTNPGFEQ